jgi:hypothetical protein
MAVALPGSLLGLAQEPAAAAPLPAPYTADAHADLVGLDVDLLTLDLAGVLVGHSRSSVASSTADGSSTASSANLGGSLVGTGLVLDEQTAKAPPAQDPPAGALLDVDLSPVIDVGAIEGDVQSAWSGPNACVPADHSGARVLSDARTRLAGLTLASLPGIGALADVEASESRTRTFLDDNGAGGSDVVSRATTTVGDISLLGGAVTVDVTSPVVLQARSDGSDGTAGYVNPPTVVATVGGRRITLPADGQPQPITLPLVLDTLVNLTLTAYPAQDQSSDPTGKATVDALLRVDLEVLDVGVLDAADVSLAIAPMSVEATAPAGGVECGAGDVYAPAAPVIESPADGGLVGDATPAVSGTAEPGSTVVVRDSTGAEVCSGVADSTTGAWDCSPTQPLPDGGHTVSATATDGAGNTSPADTVTFTVDTSTSVNVLLPADGSTTQDLTPLVRGNGEPGASLTVTLGGAPVCTATVDAEGGWSCTPALPFPPGTHTLTVTAEDEAGNTATDTTTFTIVPGTGDSTAPSAPGISSPAEGATVQDAAPLITGTGESGATVAVVQGSTVLCTAVVAGDGRWSCSSTVTLPSGQHTVSATQTDPAGNTSPADPVTFTVVAGPGDADGDGLPDQQEGSSGTDPAVPDTDGDGLSDGQEVTTGTDPLASDTDDDGLTDGAEVLTHLTDPLEADTDGDGLDDGPEVTGVRIKERFEVCGRKARTSVTVTTDPLRKDTDRDGLTDGKEVRGHAIKQRVRTRTSSFVIGRTRSNPTRKDTDRDGLEDEVEVTGKANKRFGRDRTDPTKCDTDRGGVRDGAEVRARSNPADWRSGPRDPRVREGRAPADTYGIG